MKKEEITTFIEQLLKGVDENQQNMYSELINAYNWKKPDSIDQFTMSVVRPFDRFIRALIKEKVSEDNNVSFLLSKHRFVEMHFTQLISRIEGMSCSVDKASFLINGILSYYLTSKEIDFENIAYYVPYAAFTSHKDVINYYESLISLYHGNPAKYLDCYRLILSSLPKKSK